MYKITIDIPPVMTPLESKWHYIKTTNFNIENAFDYKVVFADGSCYRDYKKSRALELYEREGVRLYGVSKSLYKISVLLHYKGEQMERSEKAKRLHIQ